MIDLGSDGTDESDTRPGTSHPTISPPKYSTDHAAPAFVATTLPLEEGSRIERRAGSNNPVSSEAETHPSTKRRKPGLAVQDAKEPGSQPSGLRRTTSVTEMGIHHLSNPNMQPPTTDFTARGAVFGPASQGIQNGVRLSSAKPRLRARVEAGASSSGDRCLVTFSGLSGGNKTKTSLKSGPAGAFPAALPPVPSWGTNKTSTNLLSQVVPASHQVPSTLPRDPGANFPGFVDPFLPNVGQIQNPIPQWPAAGQESTASLSDILLLASAQNTLSPKVPDIIAQLRDLGVNAGELPPPGNHGLGYWNGALFAAQVFREFHARAMAFWSDPPPTPNQLLHSGSSPIAGGSMVAPVGLSSRAGIPAKTKKGRKKLAQLTDFIYQMMYVSGETGEPSVETTGIIEDIVRQQVVEIVSRPSTLPPLTHQRRCY